MEKVQLTQLAAPAMFLWGEYSRWPTNAVFVNSVRNQQTTFLSIVIKPKGCEICCLQYLDYSGCFRILRQITFGLEVEGIGKRRRRMWSMAPLRLFCCVWHERNKRIFNGEELDNHKLKEILIRSPMESARALFEGECASLLDFIDNLIYQ